MITSRLLRQRSQRHRARDRYSISTAMAYGYRPFWSHPTSHRAPFSGPWALCPTITPQPSQPYENDFQQLGGPLTGRDATAPDLESVLSLVSPDNQGPPKLTPLPYAPDPTTAAMAHARPLNDMQRALVGLAANFPAAPGTDLKARRAAVTAAPQAPPPDATTDVRSALSFVKERVGNYFLSVGE